MAARAAASLRRRAPMWAMLEKLYVGGLFDYLEDREHDPAHIDAAVARTTIARPPANSRIGWVSMRGRECKHLPQPVVRSRA